MEKQKSTGEQRQARPNALTAGRAAEKGSQLKIDT